jgi:hypothetical protein
MMRETQMKTLMLFVSMLLFATVAVAQPKVCDVTYTVDTNIKVGADEFDVATAIAVVSAMPYADVLDNSDKALKVLNVMSKQGDKGGPYVIESGEVRSCDGGPPVKVAATSIMVSGVTLEGSNRIAREGLRQAAFIVDRFEKRANRGDKEGWDHKKGHKTKRNDLHQKLVAPTSDSVVVSNPTKN